MNGSREAGNGTSVCLRYCCNGGCPQFTSVRGLTYMKKDLGLNLCQAMHVV